MSKNLLFLITLFSGWNFLYSQTLEGIIIDAATSRPIESVSVVHPDSGVNTFSGQDGKFTLQLQLPATVQFSALGYEDRQLDVTSYEQLTVYLVPSSENLSEVIIRSTLIPAELRKVPAAVSIISSEGLERIDETNLAQAFNLVPGIYVNQGALNTTKLNIRGIGARSQYSTNRVQAYFDGIPLTTAEGELTLDDIDPESLSSVEIIKGPTSSIYGAGLGGVINLYSKEPQKEETRGGIRSLFGSYNMLKKTVTASHGTSNTSLFVNYNDLHTDGYRDNGEYSRQSALANASLTTENGNTLSLLANFTRLKAYIPSSINEDDFRNDPTTAAFTWAASRGYESYNRGLLGVSYFHNISEGFTNRTSVYVNFRDAYEPRPFDILKEERVAAGARTRFNLDMPLFNLNSQLSFGAEYYREWYETGTFENLYEDFPDSGSVRGVRLSNNEQDRNYTNVFAQLRMEFSNKFFLETGFNVNSTRYDLTDLFAQDEVDQSGDYTFNTIVSPRIGATYEIGAGKNFYASISHGFSIPTVAETLTPEGQINTTLEPEKGINYEIGFKGNWLNNRLYTEVAVYSIQINDLLVAQRVAEDRYVGINAGQTSHNGGEIFVQYQFSTVGGLRFKPWFNGAFNKFEFRNFEDREEDYSGNRLPGVPASTMNFGLDVLLGDLSFYSNLLAVGEIPLNDQNSAFTDSYAVLNLKAMYEFEIFNNLELTLTSGINNVLDDNYAASVLPNAVGFGGAAPRFYYPGNNRNYFGGVGLNFNF